jgi:hypothetical protein
MLGSDYRVEQITSQLLCHLAAPVQNLIQVLPLLLADGDHLPPFSYLREGTNRKISTPVCGGHGQLVTNPSPVGSPTTKLHTNISAHGEHLHGELLPGHSRVLRRRCWGRAPLWPAPRQTAPQRCCGPRPVQRRLLSLDWWLAPDCRRLDIRPYRPRQLYPSRRPSSCIPDRPSGGCEQASKWRRRAGCPLPSLVAAAPSAAAPWWC